MSDLIEQLRTSFESSEDYRAGYAESFMNSWVAAQIKVLREQRGLSQQELADIMGTKQAGICRWERTNYSAWKVQTLARLARAFDVRLRISFEEFGTLPDELDKFGREFLKREAYADDSVFYPKGQAESAEKLSEQEKNALAGGVIQMPIKDQDENNANNLHTPREIARVYRDGPAEPPRKSVNAESPAGPRKPMPIRKIAHGS
ncbi:MAG TPA: helix-turn-helix transcriptional regulator [Acidobacteriaceae bacterium]|nr:helix-turn-helix transcriptional regulator [Acidobacteriaceae bacterium]